MPVHKGSCHCEAVTFEFDAPEALSVTHCNCSLCNMTGFEHVFVPEEKFRLLTGADALTEYTFNTRTAKHLFCKRCGIKAFYRPRSHPEAYSVNLRCVKPGTYKIGETIDFDGQNWESNIAALREKT